MKKIILLFITFSYILLYSQEDYISYYLKIDQAKIQSNQKEYILADSIFNVAFKMVSTIHPDDYVDAAKNSLKMNHLDYVKKYLLIAASSGYPLKEITNKKIFKTFLKSSYGKLYKKEHKKAEDAFFQTLNFDLFKQIKILYKNDQKYRSRLIFADMKKQKTLDSLNLIEIQKLQMKYKKIPGIRELGYEGMMMMYLIFRHVDEKYTIEKLGPQIILQTKNGDFYPYMGPSIIDYKIITQVSSNKYYMTCQMYGTQLMRTPITSKKVIIPVKNYSNVNLLRKSVGLGNIENNRSAVYDEEIIKKECGETFEFCRDDINFK